MKSIQVYFAILAVSLMFSCQNSSQGLIGGEVTLETQVDSISYFIGSNVGNNVKEDPFLSKSDINLAAMMKGVDDVLKGNESAIDPESINQLMTSFQQQVMEQKKEDNEAFFNENKDKEGVVVLPSGLQYKVLQEGDGDIPTAEDQVKVHYRGTLLDGREFDSSYKTGEPAQFPVTRVIRGWIEALQMMKVGSKWELYVPPALGYGPQGSRGSIIGPEEVLIFQVELLEIVDTQQ
ncbi:MAG: FKBP-type peptidyl-prolyl cis-trans isomerase [Bacteroidota bacterium]